MSRDFPACVSMSSWEDISLGNMKGKGGSYRFSHKGWLVTLTGLITARSEVGVNWEGFGFYFPGPRPKAKCLGFHFLVKYRLQFLG